MRKTVFTVFTIMVMVFTFVFATTPAYGKEPKAVFPGKVDPSDIMFFWEVVFADIDPNAKVEKEIEGGKISIITINTVFFNPNKSGEVKYALVTLLLAKLEFRDESVVVPIPVDFMYFDKTTGSNLRWIQLSEDESLESGDIVFREKIMNAQERRELGTALARLEKEAENIKRKGIVTNETKLVRSALTNFKLELLLLIMKEE